MENVQVERVKTFQEMQQSKDFMNRKKRGLRKTMKLRRGGKKIESMSYGRCKCLYITSHPTSPIYSYIQPLKVKRQQLLHIIATYMYVYTWAV